jgi:hypothetical protein
MAHPRAGAVREDEKRDRVVRGEVERVDLSPARDGQRHLRAGAHRP